MTILRDVIQARQEREKQFERNLKIVNCVTIGVDDDKTPEVTGRSGYVWVRELNLSAGVFQVFNPGSQLRINMPVLVAYEPKPPYRRCIIQIHWDTVLDSGDYVGDPYLPNHHNSHEWLDNNPGPDAVNVYQRALVPLRTYPKSGLTVTVAPAIYMYDGTVYRYNGEDVDITSYIPAVGYLVRILLYLDLTLPTPAIQVLEGATVTDVTTPEYISPPSKSIASSWVYLTATTTDIIESLITDARAFLCNVQSLEDILSSTTFLNQILTLDHHMDYEISRHIVEG